MNQMNEIIFLESVFIGALDCGKSQKFLVTNSGKGCDQVSSWCVVMVESSGWATGQWLPADLRT